MIITEQTRLAILQLLKGHGTEGAAQDIVFAELAGMRYPGTEQAWVENMHWLAKAGLLTIDSLCAGQLTAYKLTTEGEEVCKRIRIVPGVMVPKFAKANR